METRGTFAPETRADALEYYEEVGPVAQVVVREATKAMSFGADEYDERVTPEVIRTARDATFAEMLVVHVGEEGEFDDWLAESEFDEDDVVGSGPTTSTTWCGTRSPSPTPLSQRRIRRSPTRLPAPSAGTRSAECTAKSSTSPAGSQL